MNYASPAAVRRFVIVRAGVYRGRKISVHGGNTMATYQTKTSFKERTQSFLSKFSGFARAAFVLVLAFLVLGLATIGTAQSPGRAFYAEDGAKVVFYLNYQNSKKLDKVYINVGTMYTEVGATEQLNFRRASTSNLSEPQWSTTYLGNVRMSNIYSSDGSAASSANYNWVELFDLGEYEGNANPLSTTYKLIEITFPCNMLVNEVIFLDEDGNVIPAYVTHGDLEGVVSNWEAFRGVFYQNEHYAEGQEAPRGYLDVSSLVDAQDSLRTGSTVYANFTQDEMYTLMQIDHILLGNFNANGVFTGNTDVGPLSVLLPLLGALIFGKSPFGLRVVPALFAAALVAAAYFLGKKLFKSDGYGFLTAALAALGGTAIVVGRLGLSYSALAFFAVCAFLFMYKFFEDGIDGAYPVKSAAGSVLASGIFFALAFAADPKSVWLALPLLFMFVWGVVRRSRAHREEMRAVRKEMSDKNAHEPSEEVMLANIEECEKRERTLTAVYGYENRTVWLFFVLAFVVATAMFAVLAALPFNFTYVKMYEADPSSPSMGIFALIAQALGDAFSVGNVTQFSAANASSPFGWLIGYKGATLFSVSSDAVYSALNVQANIGMTVTALVGLIFMASYAVLYFATGGAKGAYASEHAPRALLLFAVLGLAVLASMLAYAFAGQVSAANGLTFQVFYFLFIPLLFYTCGLNDGSEKKKVFGIRMNVTAKVLAAVCAVYAVLFLLSVPSYFNIPVSPLAANICFGWTSLVNNGFFR